jgi:hypothetical protein
MARGRGRGRGRVGAGSHVNGGGGGGRGRGRGKGGSVGQFLGPHTGRQAGQAANAEAGTEFNAGIRETREQAKGSRKREADLGQWYAQLASDYQGAQNQGAAALKSVEDVTTKQQQEAGARSSADQAALGASDEAFANLVGGPKDTAGLAKIAQAGQAASAARVDEAKLPISEQANFTARLGSDKAAARMQGIEQRRSEQRRRDKLKTDLAAQRKEKGQARVSNKDKIREADRGYVREGQQLKLQKREANASEQQAAAEAALARIKSAQEARQDAIGNRQAQERVGISRTNAQTAAASQRTTAKHYKQSAKAGALSPGEKNTNRKERQNAAALIHSAIVQVGPPKSKAEAAELERLAVEAGGAPREVHRAVQVLLNRGKAKSRKGYASRAAAERAGHATHR